MMRQQAQTHFSGASHRHTFAYAKEIERAYKTFPDLLENAFFVNVAASRAIHPNEDKRNTGNYIINTNRDLSHKIHNYYQVRLSEHYWTRGYDFILLYQEKDMKSDHLGPNAPYHQRAAFIFDHELAHAMSKDKTPGVKSESLADAYALLRHYQRFGIASNAAEELAAYRLQWADFGSKEGIDHYTSPIARYIGKNRHKLNIMKLTPMETFQLAERLAECVPQEKELLKNPRAQIKSCALNLSMKS